MLITLSSTKQALADGVVAFGLVLEPEDFISAARGIEVRSSNVGQTRAGNEEMVKAFAVELQKSE